MSQEYLEKLFSENSIDKETGKGLGMMLTKTIINAHNGEIWAESKLGKGSTFHFTIPVAKESTPDDE